MTESWLPIPGYEGLYDASTWGRIRSLDRYVVNKEGVARFLRGRILRQNIHYYLQVSLYKNGKQRNHRVHALIALTFIGQRPDGQQVLHGPLGKLVNTPENLCYGTPSENEMDKVRDGTDRRGERHHNCQLTKEQVLEIFSAPRTRGSGKALAAKYGVTNGTIGHIRSGKRWGWLTSPDDNPAASCLVAA